MRPTSADVARVAKVSRATVSYVLNDRQDVRITEAVRRRVLAAAHELSYVPSPAARALRAGRGDVVLVLMPELETIGPIGTWLEDVGELLSHRGLACLRYEGTSWRGHLGELLALVSAAAVITLEPLEGTDAAALNSAAIPEIRAFFLDRPGHPHTSQLTQIDVVSAQVEHLRDRGYRRLAYLATEDEVSEPILEARVSAFRNLCRGDVVSEVRVVPDEVDAVTDAVDTLARAHTTPLGVCAWNDHTAIGVLTSARTLGIEVPAMLGVIGCDDTPTARMVGPALSSVRMDLKREAALVAHHVAVALALPAADLPEGPHRNAVAVPRQST